MAQRDDIEALVCALDAQRAELGDATIDFAIAAIRESEARGTSGARLNSSLAPDVAPEPKLRQVTILFCDIVGSTAMLQSLSPEDAIEVIQAPLEAFADAVTRSGGKVLRFTGDGLKAAFGAETSREDDAERAVAAALELLSLVPAHATRVRRDFGIDDFAIRVGINTGPVMLGGGIEADKTAMGHAVHIAARMEQHAPVGALRISHGTWLHVRGLFEMEAQPPLAVKGSSEPLLTYLVRRPIAREFRVVNRGLEGVATPMVGRDAQLAALLDIVDEARSTRALRGVTVIAEAGLGKSRLLHEFRQAIAGRHPANDTLRLRARPASALQPYGALRGLVATRLGITDDASAETARRTLVEGLAPLLGERGELQAQLIGRLIGVDFPDSPLIAGIEGRELRTRAFRALRAALVSLAASAAANDGVLLILLDDLHWVDDGSLDFIASLFDEASAHPPQPIVVLMLARGELLERRTNWLQSAAAHSRMPLARLDDAVSAALADALLQRARDVPAALRRLLVERTEGNPFYMEELVRMLMDDGVIVVESDGWHVRSERMQTLKVPSTLVGVLQARLEALPPSDRLALQQASIIGPVFWDSALAALDPAAPASLESLKSRGLIHARGESSFEGTAEHAFHHQILHDVTYATVLKSPRQQGHARTAAWLAERVRSGDLIGVTADHYERAGDSARALEYFDRASNDAVKRYAIEDSVAYNERALRQPALVDEAWRFELLARRFWLADRKSNRTACREALDAAAEHAERCDNDFMRALVSAHRAIEADRSGDAAKARLHAERATLLGEKAGHATAAALGHGELAWLAIGRRDHDACRRHVDAGVPWARRAASLSKREGGGPGYELQLLQIDVESLILQNRCVEAAAELDRALTLQSANPLVGELYLIERRVMVLLRLGDHDGARATAERMVALARECELPRMGVAATRWLAEIAGAAGDLQAQLRYAMEATAGARTSDTANLPSMLLTQGDAHAALGDDAAALPLLLEARAGYEAREHGGALACRASIAAINVRAGDMKAARDEIESVLADISSVTSDAPAPLLLTCRKVLRALADAEGRDDSRVDALLDDVLAQLERVLAQASDASIRERIVRNVPQWREAIAERERLAANV